MVLRALRDVAFKRFLRREKVLSCVWLQALYFDRRGCSLRFAFIFQPSWQTFKSQKDREKAISRKLERCFLRQKGGYGMHSSCHTFESQAKHKN